MVKGGAARSPFLSYIRNKLNKNIEYVSKPARDFDFIYIGKWNWDVDYKLSATKEDYEFINSIEAYLNTRDFPINEVLIRPGRLIFSKRALNAARKNINTLSGYERARSLNKGYVDNYEIKKALKTLLLNIRENLNESTIDDFSIIYDASYFWLLVFMFKAYETNIEDEFFKKLKLLDAIDSHDFKSPDDYLLHLLSNVEDFNLTEPQQEIVDRIKKDKEYSKYEHIERRMDIERPDPMRLRRTPSLKYAAQRVILSYLRRV